MSHFDIEPLVRGDSDPLERKVLGSARADSPRADAKEQMLAALDRIAAPGSAPASMSKRSSPYLQGIGLALVIGAGVAGLMSVSSRGSSNAAPQAESQAESAREHATAPLSETPAAEPPVVERVTTPADLPESGQAAPSHAHAPAQRAPREAVAKPAASGEHEAKSVAAPGDSTLAREIARVSAARSALAEGDGARTLQLLDAYDAEFPSGVFALEVSVIRIEALARSRRLDEARRLGARFLAQHPHGAFARRVTETLESTAPPEAAPTRAAPIGAAPIGAD